MAKHWRSVRLLAATVLAAASAPWITSPEPAVAATGVSTEFVAYIEPGISAINDWQKLRLWFLHDAPGNPAVSEGNGVTFTVPSGFAVVPGSTWYDNQCQGTVTVSKAVVAGATKITVAGVSVPNGDSCSVYVDVTSATPVHVEFADETVSNPSTGLWHLFGNQGVRFMTAPKVTAAFADSTMLSGATTMLNVLLQRSDSLIGYPYAHGGYEVTLPAGLTVAAGTPTKANCGGGSVVAASASTISLTNVGLDISDQCGVQVPVTASAGTFNVSGLDVDPAGHGSVDPDLAADVSCSDVVLCGSPTLTVGSLSTVPIAPAAPSGTPGNASASVTWSAPASDGGSPVTSYTVRAYHDGVAVTGGTCALSTPFTPPLHCTVTGLTNGTAYTFRTTASNTVGAGTESPDSPPVTPLVPVTSVPAAPTATAGNAAATVTWSASAGGFPYTVRAFHNGTAVAGRTCTVTAAPLHCTVTGLTNGTAYTFRIAGGAGAESTDSAAVTPTAAEVAPGAPVSPAATPGNASAVVTWAAPASTDGPPITGYTVTATPGSATCSTTTALTCTLPGLTNGTAYQVRVTATNAAGTSEPSAPVSVTPLAPPSSPGAVTATGGTSSITVDWAASPSSSGAPVTGYTVTASPGPATCKTLVTDPNPTQCVLGGTAGSTYTVTVTADSASGASAPTAPSNPATVATPVAPPAPPSTSLELTTDKGRINTATPGEEIVVLGTGFAAHSTATITIYSDPITLGTVVTDANGTFSKPVTIPAGLAKGGHAVVAQGVDPAGNQHAMRLDVTVGATPASTTLPVTGDEPALLLTAGLVLLTAGGALRYAGSTGTPWRRRVRVRVPVQRLGLS